MASSSPATTHRAVHIVGLGAQTSVGRTAASSFAAVNAGISRMANHPTFVDQSGRRVVVSKASYLSEELSPVSRMIELIVPSIAEALAPLREHDQVATPIPAFIGLPSPRPDLPSSFQQDLVKAVRSHLGADGNIGDIHLNTMGNVAGLWAIEQACERIIDGRSSACLACGVDSSVDAETMAWLESGGRLRTREVPLGLTAGEASGVCLLASQALTSRVRSLGRIVDVMTVSDSVETLTGGDENRSALAQAWRSALRSMTEGRKVARVICDLNGERARELEFQTAFMTLMSSFALDLSFIAPTVSWGDVGAASGPLFAGMAVVDTSSDRHRRGPTLISTSTDGRHHGAALVAVDH